MEVAACVEKTLSESLLTATTRAQTPPLWNNRMDSAHTFTQNIHPVHSSDAFAAKSVDECANASSLAGQPEHIHILYFHPLVRTAHDQIAFDAYGHECRLNADFVALSRLRLLYSAEIDIVGDNHQARGVHATHVRRATNHIIHPPGYRRRGFWRQSRHRSLAPRWRWCSGCSPSSQSSRQRGR